MSLFLDLTRRDRQTSALAVLLRRTRRIACSGGTGDRELGQPVPREAAEKCGFLRQETLPPTLREQLR